MSILETLTKTQRAVFDFIKLKIDTHGHGPSVREICDQFDIASANGAMCYLKALAQKGAVSWEENDVDTLKLTSDVSQESHGLPLAGQVVAGTMREAIEQVERIDIASMFVQKNQFVLEVSGNSMIDAHIRDGDYVVITRRRTAKPGEIVVAQIDSGESTLKYWYPEESKSRIRLQPANKNMKPIYVKDAKVIGVLSGVVRKMCRFTTSAPSAGGSDEVEEIE